MLKQIKETLLYPGPIVIPSKDIVQLLIEYGEQMLILNIVLCSEKKM